MKRQRAPAAPRAAYKVRELEDADIGRGFLKTLENLSQIGDLSPARARQVLKRIRGNPLHFIFVAVTEGEEERIVGALTLLVEPKFIHAGGLVGHIEDVSVREGHEGKGVGSALVAAAVAKAKKLGCYKCILDCKNEVAPFYERSGFRRHELAMRMDLPGPAPRRG